MMILEAVMTLQDGSAVETMQSFAFAETEEIKRKYGAQQHFVIFMQQQACQLWQFKPNSNWDIQPENTPIQ